METPFIGWQIECTVFYLCGYAFIQKLTAVYVQRIYANRFRGFEKMKCNI